MPLNNQLGVTADAIYCNGFCDSVFHLDCSTLDRGQNNAVKKNKNVLFICDACLELLQNNTFRSNFIQSRSSVENDALKLFSDELSQCKKLMQDLSERVDKTAMQAPQVEFNRRPRIISASNFSPAAKRRAIDELPPQESVQSICGTKSADGNPIVNKLITPKFWLHLSKFSVDTTEGDISGIVADSLNIDKSEIEVVKLVSKNSDQSKLRFITFKVGINQNLKGTALDPSAWPSGLFVRVFVPRTKNPVDRVFTFRKDRVPQQPATLTQSPAHLEMTE